MLISVGNVAPQVAYDFDAADPVDQAILERDGGDIQSIPGKRLVALNPLDSHTTVIEFPDGEPLVNLVPTVASLWGYHSAHSPGWVQSDDDEAQRLLEDHFGIVRPSGILALLTNAGRDFACEQISGAGGTSTAKFMALTANSTAPSAGSTTLTGEIATAGGGLIRGLATYAHTNGTSTYTLTRTFTANGSDSLPVTVAKIGVFTASSGGTLALETLLSATATLTTSGDQLVVTDTVTVA